MAAKKVEPKKTKPEKKTISVAKSASKKSDTKPHIHYHKDGSLWAKGQLNGSIMEGYWEWYRKDGSIMRSGYFIKGKQTGEWTTYAADGRLVKVTKFK